MYTGESCVTVDIVLRLLDVTLGTYKKKKKLILEENPLNVNSMAKRSHITVFFRHGFFRCNSWEKNPINVKYMHI